MMSSSSMEATRSESLDPRRPSGDYGVDAKVLLSDSDIRQLELKDSPLNLAATGAVPETGARKVSEFDVTGHLVTTTDGGGDHVVAAVHEITLIRPSGKRKTLFRCLPSSIDPGLNGGKQKVSMLRAVLRYRRGTAVKDERKVVFDPADSGDEDDFDATLWLPPNLRPDLLMAPQPGVVEELEELKEYEDDDLSYTGGGWRSHTYYYDDLDDDFADSTNYARPIRVSEPIKSFFSFVRGGRGSRVNRENSNTTAHTCPGAVLDYAETKNGMLLPLRRSPTSSWFSGGLKRAKCLLLG